MFWQLVVHAGLAFGAVLLVILLVLPIHSVAGSKPRLWSLLFGAVIGGLTTVGTQLSDLDVPQLSSWAQGIVLALILFMTATASVFVAAQHVENPVYPTFRESLKDWLAYIGFWIACSTSIAFFLFGLEAARTFSSRATTTLVSMGIVVFLGFHAGAAAADFVLHRSRGTPQAPA